MKKYIFTENQIKKIIDSQITENTRLQEQTMLDDQKSAINAGTKAFLDAKKIMGSDLTDRIIKYQKSIGCEPTGHMMDCQGKLPENDKKLWKSLVNKNKPFLDKALDWFNSMLGMGPGSGY
jgi:hypothetical protein